MKAVFADSYYFFALLNPRDAAHAAALSFSAEYDGQLVTTAWVLTEVADGLSRPEERPAFASIFDHFNQDPLCDIVLPDAKLFEAGVQLFRSRPDKYWSLTDCVSFVVMKEHGLEQALTGDRHFEQAGFSAVFKDAE